MAPEPITLEQLGRLAVDNANRLYWDGNELVTVLSLPWYVNVAVIIGALAAIIGALAAVVNAGWPIWRHYRDR